MNSTFLQLRLQSLRSRALRENLHEIIHRRRRKLRCLQRRLLTTCLTGLQQRLIQQTTSSRETMSPDKRQTFLHRWKDPLLPKLPANIESGINKLVINKSAILTSAILRSVNNSRGNINNV